MRYVLWDVSPVVSAVFVCLYKPEICASIIRNLLVSGQKSPTFVYVACLALDTLLAHEQGEIRKLYNELIQVDDITPLDLLEVVSLCKLRFLNSNLDMLLFYRNNSNGHETQLKSTNGWRYSDYFTWMLENAYAGQMRHNVRRMRLELTRSCDHYPLKVACIPISPPALCISN